MNQDDFRNLLATAKSEKAEKAAKQAAAPKAKKKKRPRPAFLDKKKDEEDENKIKYRDRASERRTDANPDYENTISRLVGMDEEHSKYLGGDMKHTHLVKGLDYALLNKVKDELTTLRSEVDSKREEQKKKAASPEKQAHKTITVTKAAGVGKSVATVEPDADPVFRTRVGAAVHGILCPNPMVVARRQQQLHDKFSPGRTMIEFKLVEEEDGQTGAGSPRGGKQSYFDSDIPLMMTRAKEDCREYADSATAMIDCLEESLFKKITRAMEYARGAPKGEKKKRRKTQPVDPNARVDGDGAAADDKPAKKAKVEDDSDDDIFGGAGKYEPPVPKPKATKTKHVSFGS